MNHPEFTSAYKRLQPETTSNAEQARHARQLEQGLARLGSGFRATICPSCCGTGSPKWQQSPFKACPLCTASGLLQGSIEAPPSVVAQVLSAATREAEQ